MSESEAAAIVREAIPAIEILGLTAAQPITTPAEYEASAAYLREIKGRITALEAEQKRLTDPANELLGRIRDLFRKPLDRLRQIEAARKAAQITYRQEAERRRVAEQARVQEAARKEQERLRQEAERKAAVERARAEAEAEQAAAIRREAEAKAAESASAPEVIRILAEASIKALALESKAASRMERAAEIRENVPTVLVPVVAQTAIPKVRGESLRTYWHARVVDPKLVPDQWWVIYEKGLQDFAGATKGTIPVPGVEFYSTQTLTAERT